MHRLFHTILLTLSKRVWQSLTSCVRKRKDDSVRAFSLQVRRSCPSGNTWIVTDAFLPPSREGGLMGCGCNHRGVTAAVGVVMNDPICRMNDDTSFRHRAGVLASGRYIDCNNILVPVCPDRFFPIRKYVMHQSVGI